MARSRWDVCFPSESCRGCRRLERQLGAKRGVMQRNNRANCYYLSHHDPRPGRHCVKRGYAGSEVALITI